ncbi:MAG: serine/threonine protein kinase [Myxococcales bacterium]|nr:serine/threonine protein kinase [Myxococcales bacterium]
MNDAAQPSPHSEGDLTRRLGLNAGDVIGGRYEIVRLLGEGGMGAVFEARHQVLGRAVAIKILKPEIATNKTLAARFLQEAKAAAELHHRNIVELTDYGVDGERPYMVMEILKGESYGDYLKRTGVQHVATVVQMMEPVLKALSLAHDRGIVHRDIKPDNIFLVADDEGGPPTPKIVDFGIAKRQDENVNLTQATTALGTPAYMAPEQIMSSKTVTGAADQYAIGTTLYEALSGRNPFNADTLNAFIVAKATQEPTSLSVFRPDLDPQVVAVVMKTLARNPADRFASAAALREALAPWRGAPTTSLPPAATGASQRPFSLDTAAGVSTAAPAPALAPARSRTPFYLVAALVALGLGAVALRRGPASAPAPTSPTVAPEARPEASPQRPAVAQRDAVFSIRVEPSTAEIVLDEVVLGVGRAEVIRPRDGRPHQLLLRAPGYHPLTEVITADADLRIERNLDPEARPAATARPPRPVAAPAVPVPAPAAPAAQPATPPPTPAAQPSPPPAARPNVETPRDPRHPNIERENPF